MGIIDLLKMVRYGSLSEIEDELRGAGRSELTESAKLLCVAAHLCPLLRATDGEGVFRGRITKQQYLDNVGSLQGECDETTYADRVAGRRRKTISRSAADAAEALKYVQENPRGFGLCPRDPGESKGARLRAEEEAVSTYTVAYILKIKASGFTEAKDLDFYDQNVVRQKTKDKAFQKRLVETATKCAATKCLKLHEKLGSEIAGMDPAHIRTHMQGVVLAGGASRICEETLNKTELRFALAQWADDRLNAMAAAGKVGGSSGNAAAAAGVTAQLLGTVFGQSR